MKPAQGNYQGTDHCGRGLKCGGPPTFSQGQGLTDTVVTIKELAREQQSQNKFRSYDSYKNPVPEAEISCRCWGSSESR